MGTCGWSYDDWVGPFYPKSLSASDRLSFFLERFPLAEVNGTHYALPAPSVVAHWVAQLEKARDWWDAPEMTLKAPKGLTHENRTAADVRAEAESFWGRCGEPLASQGLLGGILLQYPPWLPEVPARKERIVEALESGAAYASLVERLEAAGSALQGARLAVELRNKAGLHPETLEPPAGFLQVLRRLGATLVAVDGPHYPPLHVATSREAYVRFHGRNADIWDEPGSGAMDWGRKVAPSDGRLNRYDYAYSGKELAPWVRRIRELAPRLDTVRVLFNNPPRAKAAGNARQMMDLLGLAGPRPHGGQQSLTS